MKIHHSRPAAAFTVIPNATLRDERLSFAARGHLAYLLSLPDGWKASADNEAARARKLRPKRNGEGREAMRAIYAELKKAGYLHSVRVAGALGRWKTETYLYDRPVTDVRLTDSPESRTSVPPAGTPEPVDNSSAYPWEYPADVSPVRTDVRVTGQSGSRHVGEPTPGEPYVKQKTDYVSTEDEDPHGDLVRAGDPIADKEQPNANSQASSHWPGNDGPDAQQCPPADSESTTDGHHARETANGGGRMNGHSGDDEFEERRRQAQNALTEWERAHPEAVER